MEYSQGTSPKSIEAYRVSLRGYMLLIYIYMMSGLLVTGLSAMLALSCDTIIHLIYAKQDDQIVGLSVMGWVVTLAPLALALPFEFGFSKVNSVVAHLFFWPYAALLGASLSALSFLYAGEDIQSVFFIAAFVFGGMAFYGYVTQNALISSGSLLLTSFLGIGVSLAVNFVLNSSKFSTILSILLTLIFMGLLEFDRKKLKDTHDCMYKIGNTSSESSNASILGALILYLDVINIYVHLLRMLGKKKHS